MSDKAKVVRVYRVWAGFVDGRLPLFSDPDYYDGVPHGEFFKTRAAARRCYEDVRRVEIREVSR